MNIYLKSKSVIVEGCEKEMPEKTRLSFMSANSFSHAIELNAWEKEINSLPHIPVLNPPTEWEDGKDVTDLFTKQLQVLHVYEGNTGIRYTSDYPSYRADDLIKEVKTLQEKENCCYSYRIVAIPLPSSPNQDNGREAEKPYYSHSNEEIEKYQRLFNAIHGSNGIALESEMDDIIKIVHEDFPVAKKYTPAPQPSKEVSRTAMQEDDLIIRGLKEGAANWKSEYDNCRAILKELVDLKVMKENLYKGNPDGKEYAERKPKAWEAAKIFLSTYQHH